LGKVNFINTIEIIDSAERIYAKHKKMIRKGLPDADIQHVGSTAIPNSLTKGDVDIQVRVKSDHFFTAVEKLSNLYDINDGSVKTEQFRAFEDETENPSLGVQLTVKGSEYDFFWKFRDVLIMNDTYREKYDNLKIKYEGIDMERYRDAKGEFFDKIMTTPEYMELQ